MQNLKKVSFQTWQDAVELNLPSVVRGVLGLTPIESVASGGANARRRYSRSLITAGKSFTSNNFNQNYEVENARCVATWCQFWAT